MWTDEDDYLLSDDIPDDLPDDEWYDELDHLIREHGRMRGAGIVDID